MIVAPPHALRRRLAEGLGDLPDRIAPAPGGDTCHAAHVHLGESRFFLKWRPGAPPGFFQAEADGLRRIREAGALAPRPLVAEDAEGEVPPFLLMAWVPHRRRAFDRDAFGRELATHLAAIHSTAADTFGLDRPTSLRAWTLDNTASPLWPDFFVQRRLNPALAAARQQQTLRPRQLERAEALAEAAAERLPARPTPRLLHGHLVTTNVIIDADAHPVFVDPSCVFGHREVDLATAELYGGFPSAFFDAYRALMPLDEGYQVRKRIYQAVELLRRAVEVGGRYRKDLMALLADLDAAG